MRPPPPQVETVTIEFPKHWVNRAEALRLIGRGKVTLWKWERAGLIQRRNRAGIHVFEVNQLLRTRDRLATRMQSTQFAPKNDGHVAQRNVRTESAAHSDKSTTKDTALE